jgi:hypothetical protein
MREIAPDRYDEIRREWIARRAGIFTIQKRRAEVLNRQIRDRNRRAAGARPNPHDDNVIHPLTARRPTTVEGFLELAIVGAALLCAPVGWALGYLLYRWVLTFIPDRLRSYPIPALLWSSVGIGMVTVLLYDPGERLDTALTAPWLIAQVPATFLVAGIYGILNGWLAVDGAADWWPIAPRPTPVDLDIPMGADDITGPGVFHQMDLQIGEERTPLSQSTNARRVPSALPTLSALTLAAIGVTWTVAIVMMGTKGVVTQAFTADMSVAQTTATLDPGWRASAARPV